MILVIKRSNGKYTAKNLKVLNVSAIPMDTDLNSLEYPGAFENRTK
jgi:hypothetical protein